mgnify:CR=1 FL=1
MRQIFAVVIAGVALLCSAAVDARDTRLLLSIDDALKQGRADGTIDEDMKFRFGKGNKAGAGKLLGSDVANRKTNAVNKTDIEACNWVFLSALKALQQGARGAGGTAVVEIVSYYKKREFSSATEFECHAGNIMAGVALKGTYAK